MRGKAQISYYLIIAVVMLLLAALGLYVSTTNVKPIMVLNVSPQSAPPEILQTTPESHEPIPVERPAIELNTLTYIPGQNKFEVFLVPINYNYSDPDFQKRVSEYIQFETDNSNFTTKVFYVVNETFWNKKKDCPDANLVRDFVDDWHQRRYGMALPGRTMAKKVPVFKYRVIGIDSWKQNVATCGCGYTSDIYGPAAYVGGGKCSRQSEALFHEMGHSFGLCDEYDTCTWDSLNKRLLEYRDVPCINSKPSSKNSACTDVCCSEVTACCLGKYADTKEDNAFNIMGAVGSPVKYKTSTETRQLIDRYVCKMLSMCGGYP